MEKVTLGGERVGSGKKMQVELHGFERSNHDLSYAWRSTMSAGTLVPFMCELGLPGDTIDINLQGLCLTNPTLGPLFGSYKIQYDVFQVPIRLYNSWLHNNKLEVGRNMSQVKLPKVEVKSGTFPEGYNYEGWEQIEPSCLLQYLGIRGVGYVAGGESVARNFNAVPLLTYWEIYKNYYSNKQEEIGVYINAGVVNPITSVVFNDGTTDYTLPLFPTVSPVAVSEGDELTITFTGGVIEPELIVFYDDSGDTLQLRDICDEYVVGLTTITTVINDNFVFNNYNYLITSNVPHIETFPLSNIDEMKEQLLATAGNTDYMVNKDYAPYSWMNAATNTGVNINSFKQQGLACKTYQSDIFNNWLNNAWISDVANQSAVSVVSGQFTIDELTIKKKVWELLNRIAVSGGTYDDWIMATYDQKPFNRAESPVYIGGMSQELIFSQVVSTAHADIAGGGATTQQPLGTLAGRGNIDNKSHKGGTIIAKCTEHCYIIGIVSLTPRIDYSQGNRFDVELDTMDDFHKPSLDQIGFQDLITEKMAWFDTQWDGSRWQQSSAGKQPAWIDYQTNFNRTYGNFARPIDEMWMTLNRRYEMFNGEIKDLTTYIDPSKYNFIFAETKIDAQNFWMQIGVNIEARRKMSAKIMPNL